MFTPVFFRNGHSKTDLFPVSQRTHTFFINFSFVQSSQPDVLKVILSYPSDTRFDPMALLRRRRRRRRRPEEK